MTCEKLILNTYLLFWQRLFLPGVCELLKFTDVQHFNFLHLLSNLNYLL